MKLKRLGSIFLAAAMMTAALTGCGGGDSKAEGGDSKAEGGKSTVTLWATGSDNVRSIFEKLSVGQTVGMHIGKHTVFDK